MRATWRVVAMTAVLLAGTQAVLAEDVEAKLDRQVPGFAVQGETLEKTAEALGKQIGVEVRVDKRRLANAAAAKVNVKDEGKNGWELLEAHGQSSGAGSRAGVRNNRRGGGGDAEPRGHGGF